VQPYERGTLADATTAVFPAASSSTSLREGQAGRTAALWPAGAAKPTREQPQLSMVLVPHKGAAASDPEAGAGTAAPPSWVFPFDLPAAPDDGNNQVLAVNTTDGSVVYDVAFALVWADDGEPVDTSNEAYAFASCADCVAVAVGFQVVLIVGQADVIVPENLSAAANYNCVRCLTYALANQLVVTLDGPLSQDGMARLNALWQQIADYGRHLPNVPLSEIQGKLNGFKEQITAIIKADPSATKAGTATSTETAGPGPTSGWTAPPSSGSTAPAPVPAGNGAATAPPAVPPTTQPTQPAPGDPPPSSAPTTEAPAPPPAAPPTAGTGGTAPAAEQTPSIAP
jgi:putative peptide zinc metalloprotease protein